jgi:tetratricopeptide (TPR) repeat protein
MIPLVATLIAATPPADPEDNVRQGNAAFERGEFDVALKLYGQAEERITNPSMVAFNKAAALYRSGEFRDAELHYRRSLEEASGARRAAILFDLGNCLLMESKGVDAKLLRQAVDCYALCLREPETTDALRADTRYNLELAKILWVKARQARPNKDQGPDDPDEKKNKPEPKTPDEKTPGGADPTTGQKPEPGAKAEPVDRNDPRQPIPVDTMQAPGSGNLPPVPDKPEATPMTAEDAVRHLKRASERVLTERAKHRKDMAAKPSRVIDDW